MDYLNSDFLENPELEFKQKLKSESSAESMEEESESSQSDEVAHEIDIKDSSKNQTELASCFNIKESAPSQNTFEMLNLTDSTGVTQGQSDKVLEPSHTPEEESDDDTNEADAKNKKKRKKKSIFNKRVAFYVKDARYEVIKRIAKNDFEWRNTYKDEEECNIIWSDIGLQPDRLQNMKPFQ